MLAEKCGKQLPKAMGYLGLAWGLVMPCSPHRPGLIGRQGNARTSIEMSSAYRTSDLPVDLA